MATNSMYFAGAEISYRRNRADEMWKPVRRSRRKRARNRELDRVPEARRPLDDDIVT